ncbi:MAG: alpha/beta hydrolase, partial [Selenomonadaceae bacterium]|nr:alpha/beta hydrolase [Selenomonadaceae bacterium]
IKTVVLLAPSPTIRDNALRGNLFHVTFDALNPPEYIEINTPYGKRKVGREYILTAQTLPIYETTEKFTGNALMIHGTGDTHTPYTYSLSYKKIYKHGEVELLDRVGHSFKGHESFVVKLASDWFVRQLK